MSMRAAFLAAIATDPCDSTTRLVFADWLEEQDCPSEADEQRRCSTPAWQESWRWLVDFALECGETATDYPEGDSYRPLTVADMIEAGQSLLDNGYGFVQMGSEQARDVFRDGDNARLYWQHWRMVASVKQDEDDPPNNPFSCSC